MPKKDAVVTAISGYGWDKIRPYVISLERSGFTGDKIAFVTNTVELFARNCLENRGFIVIPVHLTGLDAQLFGYRGRFVPFIQWLKDHGSEYRYVVWADCGDQVVQANPSDWLTKYATPHTFIAAREGWLIKEETQWNDPWVKAAVPDDYDWVREHEVICSGTMAGDAGIMLDVAQQIYEIVNKPDRVLVDQAALNYILRKPFNVHHIVPDLNDGWCATVSSVITENFLSCCGFAKEKIAIAPPVFVPPNTIYSSDTGLVLTPDGRKPFIFVHQYNRDGRWIHVMQHKYTEW
jgi:hypothetical protein